MTTISIKTLNIHITPGTDSFPMSLGVFKLPDSATKEEVANQRFVTSDDGTTVTDNKTGLTWSQDKVGGKGNYESAEKAVAECRVGGHEDWRIPSRVELESILDLERHSPAIDPAFTCDTNYWYWTSTPYAASSSDYVWFVYFGGGSVDSGLRRNGSAFVRAVRGPSPAGQ
jgi:hypothetical protein